jgi:hypothetical protein
MAVNASPGGVEASLPPRDLAVTGESSVDGMIYA